jgi:3-(3-hydroxy-phenyl)propionate hydroxylase
VTSPFLKTYPFVPPPELSGAARRHPVCIVGAGPVGLLLALELDRRGVPCVVVEPRHRASEGSRATCISRRSMDILDGVGAGEAFRQKGLGWTHGRSFYRGEVVFELEMPFPPHERHWPMTNMQQFYMEQILIDRAAEARNVDLRWHSRVAGLNQDREGVTCRVETPQGAYDLAVSHVVACDGARSAVRDLLALKLRGSSSSGRYLIADIHMPSDHWTERRAWFDPPSNPGSTVLMHKQPEDVWRVDYQILDDITDEEALDEARVCARIRSHLDMIGERTPWRLIWTSVYRARMLALDDYRHGRVFFAGDAAHLVPIFGVRGLNSGLADANNLGWKLAAVIDGRAPDRLLDTYTPERREATLDILRESGKSTAFMTPPGAGSGLMRDAALSLAIDTEATRCLINPRQSVPYDYVASPLNTFDRASDAGHPRTGAPLPNIRLDADGAQYLYARLGPDFTILACSQDPSRLEAFRAAAAASGVAANVLPLDDLAPEVARVLGARPEEVLLVRPDGHLCARLVAPMPEALATALRRAVGREDPVAVERAPALAPDDRIARTEAAFALLGDALDGVPQDEHATVLAKLALLAADAIGDTDRFRALVETARGASMPRA